MNRSMLFPAALTLAGLSIASLPATTIPAQAQSQCGMRTDIVSALSQTYKEAPAAVGQVNGDAVIEIFVSDRGSFTILATGTDGKSCIISTGEGWESTSFVVGKNA